MATGSKVTIVGQTWQGDNYNCRATWRHGDMATWRHGDMATWRHADDRQIGRPVIHNPFGDVCDELS